MLLSLVQHIDWDSKVLFRSPPIGLRGGLGLLWRPTISFDIIFSSANVLALLVCLGGLLEDFSMYLVYGPTWWQDKISVWPMFSRLVSKGSPSWVCLGDFNDISSSLDKRGGRPLHSSSSLGLRHFLESQGAIDLGFAGQRLT